MPLRSADLDSVLWPGSSEAAMANPAAQAHCRCQSPSESTVGERDERSASVRSVQMASIACFTLAISSTAKSGDRYVKAAPAIDPLLERRPTGSKAPAARPRLPTLGHSWPRASEIRAEREPMGSCA